MISFQLKSIDIDFFDIIRIRFSRFRRNDLDFDDKFGSQNSIKRPFCHDIKQNLALDGLDCQSLNITQKLNCRKKFGHLHSEAGHKST